jgi:hypothetical protein
MFKLTYFSETIASALLFNLRIPDWKFTGFSMFGRFNDQNISICITTLSPSCVSFVVLKYNNPPIYSPSSNYHALILHSPRVLAWRVIFAHPPLSQSSDFSFTAVGALIPVYTQTTLTTQSIPGTSVWVYENIPSYSSWLISIRILEQKKTTLSLSQYAPIALCMPLWDVESDCIIIEFTQNL